MKAVAVLMVLVGVVIGQGAIAEFFYYGPESEQFWVGVFTTPISVFFVVAGVLLWLRGVRARQIVLVAAISMASATIAATVLKVMGPPATLTGMIGALVVVFWFWRTRGMAAEGVSG
jgi:hypothetical protein